MTDKVKPEVTIMLDKERHIKYGLRALRAIEAKTGKNALDPKFWNREPSVEDFIVMLWAGLLHEDRELTIEQVVDLVDEHSSIMALVTSIYEAYRKAMPAPEKDEVTEGEDKAPLA